MSFVSHAQNFEDVMLWRALGGVERGFWIDVGAAEPDLLSVTRAFSEKGWRGINVEPAARPFALLRQARPDDINLCLAAADRSGEITLFLVDDACGLTTTDAAIADAHRAAGLAVEAVSVPVSTLAEICAAHVTGEIHFLKIDVEGCEQAVLQGADFGRFRPWIVLVESTAPGQTLENHAAWEPILLQAGYRFAWFDGLNRFYVAGEHDELLTHFRAPPNVFDDFVGAREIAAEARAVAAEGWAQLSSDSTAVLKGRTEAAERAAAAHAGLARAAQSEAARLRDRAIGLEQELARLKASASWRLTGPFRAAMATIDRWRGGS